MSDIGPVFGDSISRLLEDFDATNVSSSGRGLAWSQNLWQLANDLGLGLLLQAEETDGVGGTFADVFDVLSATGRFAAKIPTTEVVLAPWLAGRHGLTLQSGELHTIAMSDCVNIKDIGDNVVELNGTVRAVPWGRVADRVVVLVDTGTAEYCVVIDPSRASVIEGVNLADEPVDTIELSAYQLSAEHCVKAQFNHETLQRVAALGRAAQMCGAMHACLDITMQYVSDREQFGRPLKKFQAIQHHLAVMYSEVVAATTATRAALELPSPESALFESAAAIIRTREAASRIAAIAHQAHGAIGFTAEYKLGRLTKRLWAWRDEYGDEKQWCERLGALVLTSPERRLWERLTDASG